MPALRTQLLVCLALVGVSLLAFWPITDNEFIAFDDDEYITENPAVQAGLTTDGVRWAFTEFHSNNWHPLTWIVHMADQSIFGDDAGGHHLSSLLLHLLNVLALLWVLNRMTGAFWLSAFAAAMLALHPTHVESVAWASEKKDLLSAFFGILTLGAYAAYTKRPSVARYGLALVLFAFGLLSKPMLVTLPFVLLLLDYWPLGRCCGEATERRSIARLLVEKIPFFALAVASSVLTVMAQQAGGVVKTLESYTLTTRVSNAALAYVAYLGKLAWPIDLAILYPQPERFRSWQVLGALSLLVAISVALFRARQRYPAALVGWLWFIGMLVPVIGIVQVGNQAYADRYTYLPFVGLSIAIAWLAGCLFENRVILPLAGLVILAWAGLTWQQTLVWKDTATLFRHTVEVTENNYLIHDNLGILLAEQGDLDAAIEQHAEAVRVRPDFAQGHYNLGVALSQQGNFDLAAAALEQAVLQQPDFVMAHFNLAVCFAQLNRAEPALRHFREVLRINPDNVMAHRNLAAILTALGRPDEAARHQAEARRLERP